MNDLSDDQIKALDLPYIDRIDYEVFELNEKSAIEFARAAIAADRALNAAQAAAEPVDAEHWAEHWAELYRLREAVKGPIGFDTWQDAATDERVRRVRAERELRALKATPVAPAGWRMVPVEPTPEMIATYLKANHDYWWTTDELPTPPHKWRTGTPGEATAAGYRAMLSAAPQPAPEPLP